MDAVCITDIDFYKYTLRKKYDPISLANIAEIVCYENEKFSKELAFMLLRRLNQSNCEANSSYLDIISKFLNINDSLTSSRIEWILGYP